MNTRLAIVLIVCSVVGVGCTSTQSGSEAPIPSATVPASDCDGPFTRSQVLGTWHEADSAGVMTLNADGTTSIDVGDGSETETGTWEFTKWSTTPQPTPPGHQNDCVPRLKPSPPVNLVYGVLGVTEQTITLTYIGRGNTIIWNRSDAA